MSKKKDKNVTLKKTLDCMTDLIHALNKQGDEMAKHWAEIITKKIRDIEIVRQNQGKANINEQTYISQSIQSMYGGMGSFNDIYLDSKPSMLKAELYDLAEDLARESWTADGKKTYDIAENEIYPMDKKVLLKAGEVIQIDKLGREELAPKSKIIYVVSSRYPNDIDNMPRYGLVSVDGNRMWVARHNAIEPIE